MKLIFCRGLVRQGAVLLVLGLVFPLCHHTYTCPRLLHGHTKVIEFLIGLYTIDKVKNLAFIIREENLLGESLQDLRTDMLYEVPELLPKQFGFIRKGVLVSKLPESLLTCLT